MPFTHDGATWRWTNSRLPTNPDDPIFHALCGPVLDRLVELEPVSESGDPTPPEMWATAKAFVANWWHVLDGGDLDGRHWLDRIESVLTPQMSRDPSLAALEIAIEILRGHKAMEVWDFAIRELEVLLTYPVLERWKAARYPGPQTLGRWEGPVYKPSARADEYRLLRSELPIYAEFDAALDSDVEHASTALETGNDWNALRTHSATTAQKLKRLAALGATADFPDANAQLEDVVAFARSLQ